MFILCSHFNTASSEQFPNLPVKDLKDTEIEDLRARLIEDCRKLDRDFTSLVHKTLEFLEKQKNTVKELGDLVKTSWYLKPLLDLFQEAENLRDLFVERLDGYWSFFDYDVIELFIEHFGDDKLKERMDKYLTSFDQYCRRKLHEVPTIKTKSGRKGYTLRVKISKKIDETTMKEIKQFQNQLQKLFGSKLYIEGAQDGCLLLVFISLGKISSLSIEQEHQLHDMGVLQVSCGDCVIYDHCSSSVDVSIEQLKMITVMVPEPSTGDVENGKIQLHRSERVESSSSHGMKSKKRKWAKAELYLTPTTLCYKIEGLGVCHY